MGNIQNVYSPFWTSVKDFQGLIGALLGAFLTAGIGTVVALFISRKVAERGKVNFYRRLVRLQLYKSKGATRVNVVSVGRCDYGQLEIEYDIYNAANVRRTLKDISVYAKAVSIPQRLEYEEGNTISVTSWRSHTFSMEPRSNKHLAILVRLTKKSLKAHYRHNSELLFGYRTEVNKSVYVPIIRLRELEQFPMVQLAK